MQNSRTKIERKDINVLIACEESQAECYAFRELGFTAYSCDIQSVRRGGREDWHILGDVTTLLQGETKFVGMTGEEITVPRWDLIIAHPPCTYISRMGSKWMKQGGVINEERFQKMKNAVAFFNTCLNAKARYVAVENPIPMKLAGLPKPTTYACPSWYGVKYTKKTLYWLKNLPPLMPKMFYPDPKCYVRCSRGKYRSRTFPQLAEAIAEQWGQYILDELNQI